MHSDNLFAEDELLFSGEETDESMVHELEPWMVLIVDDEPDVHSMTKMVLGDFAFEDRPLEFVSAQSGKESLDILKSDPSFAV
ncbi:hybrid sensor histidine kinase/response regulator, partial [Aduncisulcus paluster]